VVDFPTPPFWLQMAMVFAIMLVLRGTLPLPWLLNPL